MFAVGLQATAVPVGYGCDLLVDPLVLVTAPVPLDAAGGLTLTVPMVVSTPFSMTVQGVVFDGVSPGYSMTNAVGYPR